MNERTDMKKHALLASGAGYKLTETVNGGYRAVPTSWRPTASGYRSTGGEGRALCSCGWWSEHCRTRAERRAAWSEHANNEAAWYQVDKIAHRNNVIKQAALDRIDEINNGEELVEVPVFMTKAEKFLYDLLSPKVVIDLIARYRKQR